MERRPCKANCWLICLAVFGVFAAMGLGVYLLVKLILKKGQGFHHCYHCEYDDTDADDFEDDEDDEDDDVDEDDGKDEA